MNIRTVGIGVVALLVITGFLLGIALAGAGAFLWNQQNQAVESAETTDATVISSSVEVDRMGSDGPNYRPNVTYRYTVGGETYRSSNVFPGPGHFWRNQRSWAADIVADYPEGETATAYYDPDDPSRSFLIADRTPIIPLILLGVGGLLAVGSLFTGIAAVVLFLFASRQQDESGSNGDGDAQ